MPGTEPSRPSDPAGLAGIAAAVDARMLALLDAERARWAPSGPGVDLAYGALCDLVRAGGKRLRPAFCHWGFVGAGGDPADPRIVDAGAAVELLHTFALVHDDVIDGSASRRGAPTAHTVFVGEHARRDWRGEGRRFGEGAAILVGDVCFVYADLLLAGLPAAVHDVFIDLRLEVNVGQLLDLFGTAEGSPTRELAERICVFKSAKYTIERPLQLGAALALGVRDASVEASLSGYGVPLGEAFQLRDDLLGAFGDPALTGKAVGDDFRSGKPTALVALARAADPASVDRDWGREDLDDAGVVRLQGVLEATGARAAVEERVGRLRTAALAALDQAPLTEAAKDALRALAVAVVDRDR